MSLASLCLSCTYVPVGLFVRWSCLMNMKQGAMSSISAEPLCSSLTPFTRDPCNTWFARSGTVRYRFLFWNLWTHRPAFLTSSQTHLPSCFFRICKLRRVMAKFYGQTSWSSGLLTVRLQSIPHCSINWPTKKCNRLYYFQNLEPQRSLQIWNSEAVAQSYQI